MDGNYSRAGSGYVLAIETSGRVGSVALAGTDSILSVTSFSTAQRHAVELLPTIESLCRSQGMAPEQIQELYVSGGPGSFTGLRIGITVARTLAWAGGVRVVRVPTLDVIAQNALEHKPPPAHVAVVLDAKRGNIYTAAFGRDEPAASGSDPGLRYVATTPAMEVEPTGFFAGLPRDAALLGEGIAYHQEKVQACGLAVLPEELYRARAEAVWRLGRRRAAAGDFDDPRQLVPIYVRRPEAEEVWEAKQTQTPADTGVKK